MTQETQEIAKIQLPEGWTLGPNGHTDTEFVRSYLDAINDGLGVAGMLEKLRDAPIFTHEGGWAAFTDLRPKLSVQFHGAKWSKSVDSATVTDALLNLLLFVIEQSDLLGVIAYIPEQCKGGIAQVKRLGFQRTGIVPLYDTWDGTPHSMEIWFLPRR